MRKWMGIGNKEWEQRTGNIALGFLINLEGKKNP